MAKKRTHFIAVQLDGAYRLRTLVPVLKRLVEECKRDRAVGIGLVSMLGFEDTAKTLKVSFIGHFCQPCQHFDASMQMNEIRLKLMLRTLASLHISLCKYIHAKSFRASHSSQNQYLFLQEGGFNSDPFDWIICNAGADIWHAVSKSQDGEAFWEADEEWEEHINHRWDLPACFSSRTLTQLVQQASKAWKAHDTWTLHQQNFQQPQS